VTAAAIAAAALGAWFGFANPLYHFPVTVLAFPAAMAVIARAADSPKRAFKSCWLAGFAAYCLTMYWVAIPVHDFGGLPWILAAPCPALLALYIGLYPALFGLVLHLGRGLSTPLYGLLAACAWASLELLRGTLLTGFPWIVLASAFSPWPEAVQAASYIGAYALSGVIAGAAVLLSRGGLFSASKILGVGVLALLAIHGARELSAPLESEDTLSVSAVQGNIDQSLKWDETFQQGTVERYLTMSESELRENDPELLVWPETALPFYFQEPNLLSGKVLAFARDNGVMLLTGAPAYRPDYENKTMILYNRAYLLGPDGIAGRYDKTHLVPFGEYIPLGRILFFLDKLVAGVGDFAPGEDQEPLKGDGFRAGILICYETIFPELTRHLVDKGANLLINISNDAWFGRSSAPLQHLHLSALRAVEQRRSIVRGTNTGISAFIDPRGRITDKTDLFSPATINAPDLELISQKTFFQKHGTKITTSYCLAAVLLVFISLGRGFTAKARS
jgi:apolipoprotein N-acyltransferase